jgi:hypothetical protein
MSEPKTYSQEEFDAAVQAAVTAEVEKTAAKIRADERKKVTEKYADYDDLKAKAEGAKTAEDQIAELKQSIEQANREALRRRVQAAHGISDEDADLFLTGSDEDALTAQAKRLADREAERKKKNNVSPREGNNPKPGGDEDDRTFVRELFGRAAAD